MQAYGAQQQNKLLRDIYGVQKDIPVKSTVSFDPLQAKGMFNNYLNFTPLSQQWNYNMWKR
jgi:hypothetical protein